MGPHRFGTDPCQQQAGQIAVGELVIATGNHNQLEGAVLTLVLVLVAGVGAGQAAQRQRSRHEAHVGVRFTSPDKLVHLIESGEVVPRLGRRLEGLLHRPVVQAVEDFTNGNQAVSFALHNFFPFSHAGETSAVTFGCDPAQGQPPYNSLAIHFTSPMIVAPLGHGASGQRG